MEGRHRVVASGLPDADARRLQVVNPLVSARVGAPEEVWFEPGPPGPPRVCWRGGVQQLEVDPSLWLGFIGLADASDERVAAFAERWGALGICEHGRPASHSVRGPGRRCVPLGHVHRVWETSAEREAWDQRGVTNVDEISLVLELADFGGNHWEPIAAWRCYARGLRALLAIGADLREGRRPRTEDWRAAHTGRKIASPSQLADPATWEVPAKWLGKNWSDPEPQHRAALLSYLVNGLLEEVGARPALGWGSDADSVTFAPLWTVAGLPGVGLGVQDDGCWPGSGLLGVLVTQVVAVITSPYGVYRCIRCGDPYTSERRPRADKGGFCGPECRKKQHAEQAAKSARTRRAKRRGDGNLDGNR